MALVLSTPSGSRCAPCRTTRLARSCGIQSRGRYDGVCVSMSMCMCVCLCVLYGEPMAVACPFTACLRGPNTRHCHQHNSHESVAGMQCGFTYARCNVQSVLTCVCAAGISHVDSGIHCGNCAGCWEGCVAHRVCFKFLQRVRPLL